MSRSNAAPTPELLASIEDVVPGWLTVPDIAEQAGVTLSQVRSWLAEGDLASVRRGERRVVSVPEGFVQDGLPLETLRGTLSVLYDAGLSEAEAVEWLHLPDETLREGTPIADLRAGHKTEIRRRAQEMAF
ncbi:Rv2175c family DNA-binding protein [Arsenicicoccus dermatophilus]|uniref:Rv2175c family DNA-binding protein n=1 Tax=Arsenicicoccus dermatophilus TaxID=1076331 RepID=UPI0039176099